MTQKYESYIIDIEIDADSGFAVLTKGDLKQYDYRVEQLPDADQILGALGVSGSQGTVYSQGETFTVKEYIELFGEEGLKDILSGRQ